MYPFTYVLLRYILLIILLFLVPLFTGSVIIKIINNNNITAVFIPLIIFYRLYIYKYILEKLIFKQYKKIIVNTSFKTITWSTVFGFFIVHTVIDLCFPAILLMVNHYNDPSYLQYLIHYLIIHFIVTIILLNRYITVENRR